MSNGYDSIDAEVENREWVDRINADTRRMRILSEKGISFEEIDDYPTLKCSFCKKTIIVTFKEIKEEAFFNHAQYHILKINK